MPRPIGYYAHHHGAGHLSRAMVIAKAFRTPCTLIGTELGLAEGCGLDTLALPDDWRDEPIPATLDGPDLPRAFHYTPLSRPWVRERMTRLAGWIGAHDPALIVVDVSVEIALFARLLSVPTVVVRLAGTRLDDPHLEAFRSAERLLAPFPALFEHADTPAWVRKKTIYAGFLVEPPSPIASVPGRVVVVLGRGGSATTRADLLAAAEATPDHDWHVYGPLDASPAEAGNLHIHGWSGSIAEAIGAASIVVAGAGDGLLADVAASGTRFICIPEDRPFDEQVAKARRLAAAELAVSVEHWPPASAWPTLLRRAEALDPSRLKALADPEAISETAAAIDALATSWSERAIGC